MGMVRVFRFKYPSGQYAPFWIVRCKVHGAIREPVTGRSGRRSWDEAIHVALLHAEADQLIAGS